MSIKKSLPDIWAAIFFSILFIRDSVEALCHFQISNSNRAEKDETSLTIQNATVDNGPSTSNGGSRQLAPVEDISRQQSYTCSMCNERFTSTRYLSFHLKRAHRIERYYCDKCYTYFSSERLLDEHILQDHKGYSFFCDKCNVIFSGRKLLSKHMNASHRNELLKCGICDKKYHVRDHLVGHMKKHGIVQTNCDYCRKILPHERLYDHKLEKHNVIMFDPQEFH